MWSPVFEKMFTSDFKEKNGGEIELQGKKASEIKELLHIMYPLEEKVVSKNNCYFLLALAREYQITSITQKCKDFLVSKVKTNEQKDVLAALIVAQEYELKTLIKTCVYEARRLSLRELKHHSKQGEIKPDNYIQITEGIIERLEKEKELCKEVKASSLKDVDCLIANLYWHANEKGSDFQGAIHGVSRYKQTLDMFLNALKLDTTPHKCSSMSSRFNCICCSGLSETAKKLSKLKDALETLP